MSANNCFADAYIDNSSKALKELKNSVSTPLSQLGIIIQGENLYHVQFAITYCKWKCTRQTGCLQLIL